MVKCFLDMIFSCKLGKTYACFLHVSALKWPGRENRGVVGGLPLYSNTSNRLCTRSILVACQFYLISPSSIFCSCKLGECRIILCEAGAKHRLQKLQLNFPRLFLKALITSSAAIFEANR